VASAATVPPKPRLMAFGPSSGKYFVRSQRTMLDEPMKTMPFWGGGGCLSATSNFLMSSSQL